MITRELEYVLKKHKNHPDNATWLLNVMGQVQNMFVSCQECTEQVLLSLNVLIYAISIFSGYVVFTNDPKEILKQTFPIGLAALFSAENWNQHVTQVFILNI